MAGDVRLVVVDRVARITIDRPDKRNAVSTEMWEAFARHIEWIDHNPDICAVVLGGSGGTFCAGGDLAELQRTDQHHEQRYRTLAEDVVVALGALRQPKLAEIEGACFGAGCSLALACDIRICSPTALFGIPALRNGLTYESRFVHRLVDVVGSGPAGLLLYGGERWDAAQATARQLVDKCVDNVAEASGQILDNLRAAGESAVAATAISIRSASPHR